MLRTFKFHFVMLMPHLVSPFHALRFQKLNDRFGNRLLLLDGQFGEDWQCKRLRSRAFALREVPLAIP